MAKIKEVCEELRKQDSEGKAPDIEKALKQIDAYENQVSVHRYYQRLLEYGSCP